MTRPQQLAQSDSPFAGDGEMHALMRSHDWSATPLGLVEQWPQSLRTTVNLILNSNSPMFILWGPHFIKLYNNAYRLLLGTSNLANLLGECASNSWPDLWNDIEPQINQVMTTGQAISVENILVFVHRSGDIEEAYFTFSLSPMYDDAGGIGGLFCVCTETTQHVLWKRRLQILRQLATQIGTVNTTKAACQTAMETLSTNLADIPFALLYLLDWTQHQAHLLGNAGLKAGNWASPQSIDFTDSITSSDWALAAVAKTAQTQHIKTIQRGLGAAQVGLWDEPPNAALAIPVASSGQTRPTAVLVVGISPRLTLDDEYQGFLELVARQVASAIADTALSEQSLQLQQQLAEIEAIYNSAPVGLNVLDTDLRFVRINQRLAEINGLPIEDHIGRTIREVVPNLADAAEQLLRPILTTGEPLLNVEITGETPAHPGVQRTWIESFLPLKDGDSADGQSQRIIGISTVCEEITDRKRIEAQRQQVEAELKQAKEELELRVALRTSELSQINRDLQESESTLRSFFNSGAMLMGIVELRDGDIVHISDNQAAAQFLGVTPEAMKNRTNAELNIPDAITQQWLEGYRRAEQTQAPVRFDYLHPTLSGQQWLSVSVCQIAFSSGGYPRFSYIAKDITDRKRVEQTLIRKEEHLRLTLEFTHIGTWDWNIATNEVIWNDNHFRLLGLEPKPKHNLYECWRNAIHPDDVERVEHALLAALNQHTDYSSEYRVVYPDGRLRWLIGKGRGIYNDAGEPTRMLGVVIDVSDRKQAERMMELQAVITRNMAEGICLVRADNALIVYANPKFEQMFGYGAGELNGQHVSIVNYATDPASAEAVNQAIRAAVLRSGEATYEVHNVKKDGTPFWCSATTSVFEHPDYGGVLVAVHQDITERKLAHEQLEASLKEKEVLLKEIHHRVKNNLGIVSSLLQMQARRTLDEQAKIILRDSQNRIASIALVHEKLYRSDDLANINFTQYIHDLTIYLFDSYNINTQQIKLSIQVDEIGLDIEAAIPCGLIINELVSNALKYAFPDDRDGEVSVQCYQAAAGHSSDGRLTLIVCDNGVGLPHDFNLQTSKTLGMVLVQGLIQQINGDLQIRQDHGTEFIISFAPIAG